MIGGGLRKWASTTCSQTLNICSAGVSPSSPHTGWQDYQDGVKRIPTACITVEDAELMWRLAQRGQKIVVRLTMGARTLPDADSFNTVAEIKGWQHPEQVKVTSVLFWTS